MRKNEGKRTGKAPGLPEKHNKTAGLHRRSTDIEGEVIPRSEATHPRVASLAPSGQFTFWESPGTRSKFALRLQEIATPLLRLAMTW